jgi:hypothetical protein
LECDGVPFPEVQWNDMVVAFCCEVLDVVLHMSANNPARNVVRFFDGPHWIELRPTMDGRLVAEAGSRHSGLGWTCVTVLNDFVNTLKAVCSEIVDSSIERGWGEQPDVRRLATALGSSGHGE